MKTKELEFEFAELCRLMNLKIDRSDFVGKNRTQYKLAKPYTVYLAAADIRLGNRYAIILNLPNGCTRSLTPFYKPEELNAFIKGMAYSKLLKNEIQKQKKIHAKGYNPEMIEECVRELQDVIDFKLLPPESMMHKEIVKTLEKATIK